MLLWRCVILILLQGSLRLCTPSRYHVVETSVIFINSSWSQVHRIKLLNLGLFWSTLVSWIGKPRIQICRYYNRLGYLCIALLFNRWRDILSNFCQVNRSFVWFLGSSLVLLSCLLTAWWSWWYHRVILDYLFDRFSWPNILVNICALDSCKTDYLHIFSSCFRSSC